MRNNNYFQENYQQLRTDQNTAKLENEPPEMGKQGNNKLFNSKSTHL